jgi:hypothetical protein
MLFRPCQGSVLHYRRQLEVGRPFLEVRATDLAASPSPPTIGSAIKEARRPPIPA